MPNAAGKLTEPAKVSRCRKHGRHKSGCQPCHTWSAYEGRRRRWEAQEGISRANVPAGPIAEHVRMLLSVGNYKLTDLVRVTGVAEPTIKSIRTGATRHVFQITAESLLAVQPRAEERPPKDGMVRVVEVPRILRGLNAQGWTFVHMGEVLGVTRTTAHKLAHRPGGWMYPDTVDRYRVMADKLRGYDIAELDKPLPGMDVRCANRAAKLGWAPLSDWDGLDIADPEATPFRAEPSPYDDVRLADGLLIDYPVLRRHLAEATEDVYVAPMRRLTKLEAYAVVHLAQLARLSAADTGALLGYPQRTDAERTTGQRQACRLRSHLLDARLWFETEPDGNAPAWLVDLRKGNKPDFHQYLPALLAVQPDPFGYGMTPAQLAERCGADVTVEQVIGFLTEAAVLAGRGWVPRVRRKAANGAARRRGRRTAGVRVGERVAA